MTLLKCFLVCFLVLGTLDPALAADPVSSITKIESRTLPPDIVTQQIFSQLAKRMRLEPYPVGGRRPRLPLSAMHFWMVPRATNVPELCESSFVTVNFDPVELGHGADTRASATGLEVDHVFYFLSEPASPVRGTLDASSRLKANEACVGLKLDNFFRAPDVNAAVSGINAFQNVVREARGNAPLSFPCKYGDVPAEECQHDLAKLEFARITDVRPCTDLDGSMECHAIWLSGAGRSITIRSHNAGGTIKKVDIGELITVGLERWD